MSEREVDMILGALEEAKGSHSRQLADIHATLKTLATKGEVSDLDIRVKMLELDRAKAAGIVVAISVVVGGLMWIIEQFVK